MDTGFVDLYQYFGQAKPEKAQGLLRFWLPEMPEKLGQDRCRPAVLILPGGGYSHVSAREGEPVALRFAARGYGCFVLEYSVAPHAFPVALREAAMAMRYIRENAAAMAIAPEQVAAIGFSAGGHLCGCLGSLYDTEAVADIANAKILRPDVLGLCYPVAVAWGRTHGDSFRHISGADEALRQRLSLEKLVRPDMPPVFLWHTRQDASVPCRSSILLAQALEEAGVDFVLHIYHQGIHGLSVADETVYPAGQLPAVSRDVPGWPEAMLEFFRELGFGIRNQ